MGQHGGQYADELPVPIGTVEHGGANLLERQRQFPVFERRAVAQGTRLVFQDLQIMPGIEAYLCRFGKSLVSVCDLGGGPDELCGWFPRSASPLSADSESMEQGAEVGQF